MGLLVRFSAEKDQNVGIFLEKAVEYIIKGKIIAFPTNSVYGIGGDPLNMNVIEKIYEIKFRERTKGLLLLLADLEEAHKIVVFNDTAKKLAEHFWPGQLTLILRRKMPNIIPPEISASQDTIGIRVPENKVILNILNILKSKGEFGGVIGTSANFSVEPAAISGAEVAKVFRGLIDLIIDTGKTQSKEATTIVDCTTENIKFLRIGKITEKEVRDYLSN